MSRDPAKRPANAPPGVASLFHRTAEPLPARPPCSGAAREPATQGLLRRLLGRTHRRGVRRLPDNLSDHMLRDLGIEPDAWEDESNFRFWRRR